MRPVTAASCTRAFSSAGSVSSLAAISAWIERGTSTSSTGWASSHREASVARSTPRSISIRTISSA